MSLQPNELRIGNYITDVWASPGCAFQVISFNVRTVKYGAKFVCRWKDALPVPLTPNILLKCGFEAIPHFTITNTHVLDVGRGRILSIGCIGEPNEMLWLCNVDHEDPKKITDLVCLHNFDYDGKLYLHRLQNIARDLTGQELTFKQ